MRPGDGNHQAFLQEQAEQGGILLWVRIAKPEQDAEAQRILKQHGATEVHVHAFPPEQRIAVTQAPGAIPPPL